MLHNPQRRAMDWLNYHHLLYFWTVAREGGVSRAAERLRLSQPTVSAQVRLLEEALGERPFQLTLGVADAVPKLIVYRLLRPAIGGLDPFHLVCREDDTDRLVADLAT